MESSGSEISVRHNAAASRFEAEADGRLAVADYERRGSTLVMTHTFVPAELRGRGLAEELVRTALDYARGEKLRVVPQCSYVARFIQRHAEYLALLNETSAKAAPGEAGPPPQ